MAPATKTAPWLHQTRSRVVYYIDTSAFGAFANGVGTVLDPFGDLFEHGWPWTPQNGFARDQFILGNDMRRAGWTVVHEHPELMNVSPNQGQLFDPDDDEGA